ncbi:twin-arginine translocase TatA/TatE family subunit [Leifsonia sp. NPDC058194]|uniref:twin-arginine translocase TatA/TatE family subunit n=1 Tax=Leifsonia sp. NPDC058194 TaxID=3346374 RepID=UPI0036D88901
MFANLTGWHLLILFAVVLLLFGASRLPALSRSIGQSMRIFRTETRDLGKNPSSEEPTDQPRA